MADDRNHENGRHDKRTVSKMKTTEQLIDLTNSMSPEENLNLVNDFLNKVSIATRAKKEDQNIMANENLMAWRHPPPTPPLKNKAKTAIKYDTIEDELANKKTLQSWEQNAFDEYESYDESEAQEWGTTSYSGTEISSYNVRTDNIRMTNYDSRILSASGIMFYNARVFVFAHDQQVMDFPITEGKRHLKEIKASTCLTLTGQSEQYMAPSIISLVKSMTKTFWEQCENITICGTWTIKSFLALLASITQVKSLSLCGLDFYGSKLIHLPYGQYYKHLLNFSFDTTIMVQSNLNQTFYDIKNLFQHPLQRLTLVVGSFSSTQEQFNNFLQEFQSFMAPEGATFCIFVDHHCTAETTSWLRQSNFQRQGITHTLCDPMAQYRNFKDTFFYETNNKLQTILISFKWLL